MKYYFANKQNGVIDSIIKDEGQYSISVLSMHTEFTPTNDFNFDEYDINDVLQYEVVDGIPTLRSESDIEADRVDIVFNNRSKSEIFKDIREHFSSQDKKLFIIKLLNKYSSFSDAVNDRDFDISREIIDLAYSENDCTIEEANDIKGFLP